jgi:hypothetical protein
MRHHYVSDRRRARRRRDLDWAMSEESNVCGRVIPQWCPKKWLSYVQPMIYHNSRLLVAADTDGGHELRFRLLML